MTISKRIRSQSPAAADRSPSKIIRLLERSGSSDDSSSSEAGDAASVASARDNRHDGDQDKATEPTDLACANAAGHALGTTPESPDSIFTQVVGPNPFSSLFPETKAILPGALAITSVKRIDGTYCIHEISPINILEFYRPTDAQRLLTCVSHPDNASIKSPKGGVMNVALAQPSSLSVHKKSGYLWSNVSQSWVVSTMCGQSTYYSNCNDTIRQISVTPFSHGWYRFAAVLAEVYGQSMLYFQSWKGGVTFGTNRFDSNGFTAGGKSGKSGIAPIEGSILKHGKQIPIFDGRSKFQLGKYWDTPYEGEIANGSTVMLLFTVKKGKLPSGIEGTPGLPEFAIYLNVVGIVVLAGPSEPFSPVASQESAPAFGVESIMQLPRFEESELEAEDDVFL